MAELSRGWMSLAGVINSHLIMAYIIANHGTEEQKQRFLPAMAAGEKRGGLALTEPHAGSDVQSIRTTAKRHGDNYVVSGNKMFITNARHGTMLAVAAKTDPKAEARLRRNQHVRGREKRTRSDRQPPAQEARLQGNRYLRGAVRRARRCQPRT